MVPEVNEMNVENEPEVNEMNVENEKENSEIKNKGPRDFVNTTWLEEKKKQENFVLRLFDKTTVENEYKSKDGGITIKLKKDEDKTVIETSDEVKEELKTDTGKWALFEIKIVDNETSDPKLNQEFTISEPQIESFKEYRKNAMQDIPKDPSFFTFFKSNASTKGGTSAQGKDDKKGGKNIFDDTEQGGEGNEGGNGEEVSGSTPGTVAVNITQAVEEVKK